MVPFLNRLDNHDVERRDSRQIRQKDFQEMSLKILLLERENRALSNENLALRLDNSEIKEILNKGAYECEGKNEISQFSLKKCIENVYSTEEQKKTAQRENPWKFPKKLQDNNSNNTCQNKLFTKTVSVYLKIVKTQEWIRMNGKQRKNISGELIWVKIERGYVMTDWAHNNSGQQGKGSLGIAHIRQQEIMKE